MCFDYLACLLVLARVSRVSDQHIFVGAAPGDPVWFSVQYQFSSVISPLRRLRPRAPASGSPPLGRSVLHKYQVLARPAGAIVLNYLLSFRFATAGRESL